jgi:hypothetical protein
MSENFKKHQDEKIEDEPIWQEKNAFLEKIIREAFGADRFTFRQLLEARVKLGARSLSIEQEKDLTNTFNNLLEHKIIGVDKGDDGEMYFLKNSA